MCPKMMAPTGLLTNASANTPQNDNALCVFVYW
jgi:hypothetical protein